MYSEADNITQVVEQLKNGDESAFATIYNQTYKYVYSRAKCMFSDEEEVQDLVQEVYLALYRNAANIQSSESIFGWLKTTTFYQGTKMLRKKRKEVLLSEESEELFEAIPDDEPQIEEDYMNKEDVEVIRECINRLSDEQKTVLLAYYYDNLKVDEIADMLEMSAGTIKSRLYLARKNLQVHIETEEKKRGYKLHSFGAVTLALALRTFLQSNMAVAGKAEEAIFAKVCQGLNFSVAQTAATQSVVVEKVAEEGVKQTGKGLLAKLGGLGAKKIAISAAGIIAAATIGGVAIGGLNKGEEKPQEPILMEDEETDLNGQYSEMMQEGEDENVIRSWQEEYTRILMHFLYAPSGFKKINCEKFWYFTEDINNISDYAKETKFYFGLVDVNDDGVYELFVEPENEVATYDKKYMFKTGDSVEESYLGRMYYANTNSNEIVRVSHPQDEPERYSVCTFDGEVLNIKVTFGKQYVYEWDSDEIKEEVYVLYTYTDHERRDYITKEEFDELYNKYVAVETVPLERYELTLENIEEHLGIKVTEKQKSFYQCFEQIYSEFAEYAKTLTYLSEFESKHLSCAKIYFNDDDAADYFFYGWDKCYLFVSNGEKFNVYMDLPFGGQNYDYMYLKKKGVLLGDVLISEEQWAYGFYELNDANKLVCKYWLDVEYERIDEYTLGDVIRYLYYDGNVECEITEDEYNSINNEWINLEGEWEYCDELMDVKSIEEIFY